jgi:predicted alpha/beta hydrolase family esterase
MTPHIFTLPGWQGSGAQHWQIRWANLFGDQVVEQHDWMQPLRGDWITRLEDAVQNQLSQNPNQNIAFVAHSLGCHLLASWGRFVAQCEACGRRTLGRATRHRASRFPATNAQLAQASSEQSVFSNHLGRIQRRPFFKPLGIRNAGATLGREPHQHRCAWPYQCRIGLGDWPVGRALLQALIQSTFQQTSLH